MNIINMDSDKKESFHEHYSRLGQPVKAEAELETEMRERMLPADPMLQYFKQKEQEKLGTHGRPTYKGHYPPNRYNIRPGYRWDGVDRSNGHEKRLLAEKAEKKASEEESYRWATKDL